MVLLLLVLGISTDNNGGEVWEKEDPSQQGGKKNTLKQPARGERDHKGLRNKRKK